MMSKKLLASLMAGVMLVSQGTSLGAVKPDQGGFSKFWKNNKCFILGGASLVGLAGGIAYLIHTRNVPQVVEIEFTKNLNDSKILEHLLDNVSKCLNEGKMVKITSIEDDAIAIELSGIISDYVSKKDKNKHIDYKLIVKDMNELKDKKSKYNITVSQIKGFKNKFELRFFVEKTKEDNSDSKENNSKAKDSKAETNIEDAPSTSVVNNETGSVSENNNNVEYVKSSVASAPEFKPEEIEARLLRGDVESEKVKGLNNICEFFKTSSLNFSSVIIDKCSRNNVENIAESIANAVDYDRSIVYRYNENTSNNTQKLQVLISRDTSGNISYVCAYFGY